MIKTSILLRSDNATDPFLHQGNRPASTAAQVLPKAVGFVQARAQDTDTAFAGVAEFWFHNATDALQSLRTTASPNSTGRHEKSQMPPWNHGK